MTLFNVVNVGKEFKVSEFGVRGDVLSYNLTGTMVNHISIQKHDVRHLVVKEKGPNVLPGGEIKFSVWCNKKDIDKAKAKIGKAINELLDRIVEEAQMYRFAEGNVEEIGYRTLLK